MTQAAPCGRAWYRLEDETGGTQMCLCLLVRHWDPLPRLMQQDLTVSQASPPGTSPLDYPEDCAGHSVGALARAPASSDLDSSYLWNVSQSDFYIEKD